jgi:probable F420-dependent oxidoreductase
MYAESADAWRGTARQAEELGYSTLFVADHYLGPGPIYDRSRHLPQNLAPIAAIAMAAEATTRLRVGCRVFGIDFHVPAVLAAETATLDLLSQGRLEVGVGAGYLRDEYESMGLPFEDGTSWVDKLEEVIALLKAHWSGQPIDRTGKYVQVSGFSGLPRPVQRPHPPLMIGGSRNRLLTIAGREADIASFNNIPFGIGGDGRTPRQELVRRIEVVRHAAAARFSSIELETSPYWCVVTDDATEALERIGASLERPPADLVDHPNVLVGSIQFIAERLQQQRDETGISCVTIQQAQLEAFAPIVARLSGK